MTKAPEPIYTEFHNKEVVATVALDGGTRRACNNPDCDNGWPCSVHGGVAAPLEPTRQEFEKWAKGWFASEDVPLDYDESELCYQHLPAHSAWMAWRAVSKKLREELANEIAKKEDWRKLAESNQESCYKALERITALEQEIDELRKKI